MQDLLMMAFGTVAGFATAGLLATGYDAATGRPLRFAFEDTGSPPALVLGIFLRVVAGPILLVRNALDSVQNGTPNTFAIALIVAVACAWSCRSGVIVLDLLGGFPKAAAAAVR
jgi:hypothetical protein